MKCVVENHPKPGITKTVMKTKYGGDIRFKTVQNDIPGRNNPVIMNSDDFDEYVLKAFCGATIEN